MELYYGIKIVLQCELPIFLCLAVAYTALFQFRDTSTPCRIALLIILGMWALLLVIPTLFSLLIVPYLIISGALYPMEPSQRMVNIVIALVIVGVIVAAWRGILWAGMHLERSSQP